MRPQGDIQADIRALTGTTGDWNGDFSALFDSAGIAAGDWNGRFIAWVNVRFSTAHTNFPAAWSEWRTHDFSVSVGGAANVILLENADGILLEDGSSYLLME